MSQLPSIAFLFPGQGSQSVGMGRDLYDNFAAARAVFEEADEALGFALTKVIFDGPEDTLRLTEHTQPAILTVSTAAARVLTEALGQSVTGQSVAGHGGTGQDGAGQRGFTPKMAAGHSLGEYSAYVAAGTLSFTDAVRAVRLRGRYMQQAVPTGEGAMAAVLGLDAKLVAAICEQVEDRLTPLPGDPAAKLFLATSAVVSAANLNSPVQTVISGAAAAVERAAELCKQAGAKRTVMLPVSAPFHCALMQPAQDLLAWDLAELNFRNPAFPVVANVSAQLISTGDEARDALVAQVTGTVRWVECVERLAASGVDRFIEVGPGRVLSGLLRQILGKEAAPALNVEDSASLQKTLAGIEGD